MTSYKWNFDRSDNIPAAERNLYNQTRDECIARIRRFASGRILERDVRRMLFVMDTNEKYHKEVK